MTNFPKFPKLCFSACFHHKQSCHTHSLSLVCPLLHTDYSKATRLISLTFRPTQTPFRSDSLNHWKFANVCLLETTLNLITHMVIAYLHQLLFVVFYAYRLQNYKVTQINFTLELRLIAYPISSRVQFFHCIINSRLNIKYQQKY